MPSETIVIQIGNSDDKLSQKEWSKYYEETKEVISFYAIETHFSGHSSTVESWQNACFVFELLKVETDMLIRDLIKIRKEYNQKSIAVMIGSTKFI